MGSLNEIYIPELPSGPLNNYRKMATFNWKLMKLFFEGSESLNIKMQVWELLEKEPVFQRTSLKVSTEEEKRISALRLLKFMNFNFITPEVVKELSFKQMARYAMTVNEALAAAFPDVAVKYAIGVLTFMNFLLSVGTERHDHILDEVCRGKIVSCLAMTEIAHGSNVRLMRTTATYDKNTQEFVINTPDFEAAKCWVGNLGKTCTMSALFAQLYIDNECYGLHVFIVPIRDPKTLIPYPGIIVGDMGEKIGLHGIDNGFIMFNNYRIPREYLLNRFSDVSIEGEYQVSSLEPSKIFAATLLNLSFGRLAVMQGSINNHISAVVIATRYAALRKQFVFKTDDKEEVPIIEYQLHQYRLFPWIASAGVLKTFLVSFMKLFLSEVQNCSLLKNSVNMNLIVSEIHAIVSSAKPLITWSSLDAIQECRQACGGHGYLQASAFGDLSTVSDAGVTYEGDNNVLQQQTSNWLLKQWKLVYENNKEPQSPLGSCMFLKQYGEILEKKFNRTCKKDLLSLDFVQSCYQWLIIYLVQKTYNKQNRLIQEGLNHTEVRNSSQVYAAAKLSRVYAEHNALNYFSTSLNAADISLQAILKSLGILYGLSCISNHFEYFYQGGYATTGDFSILVEEAILEICGSLKNNMVSVTDALAPPDYVLNSVLGKSDGKLYENLKKTLLQGNGSSLRPEWWKDIIVPDACDFSKPRSKL